MSLYDALAASYDSVFPLRPAKTAYAASLAARTGGALLDIGCATGSLAIELARRGHEVTGIDLDQAMVRLASTRAAAEDLDVVFEVLDMRRIAARFPAAAFGAILCLGNTIVHLPDAAAVGAFCRDARSLLRPGGRFAVQLLNYDRVFSGSLPSFPVIDNDHVRFLRSYRLDGGLVLFRTELTVKASGEVRRDETLLYPLAAAELARLLEAAGMRVEERYADFSGRPFEPADESLVLVAAPA